jgi:hypothetical protein
VADAAEATSAEQARTAQGLELTGWKKGFSF